MSEKQVGPDGFPVVPHDEEILTLKRDWTAEEERQAKRK